MTRKATESYGKHTNRAQIERSFQHKKDVSRTLLDAAFDDSRNTESIRIISKISLVADESAATNTLIWHARSRDESLRSILGVVARPSIHTPRAASADGRAWKIRLVELQAQQILQRRLTSKASVPSAPRVERCTDKRSCRKWGYRT